MTWGFTELVLVEIDHVATQFRVISQCAPGQWMMSFTHAKEPSEAQDSVGHLAGAPPDHEIFDCAKSLALSIVHRRTLGREEGPGTLRGPGQDLIRGGEGSVADG